MLVRQEYFFNMRPTDTLNTKDPLMTTRALKIIGAPVETGAGRRGCQMGPDALRTAGLQPMLEGMGYTVEDAGNIAQGEVVPLDDPFEVRNLAETVAWTKALEAVAFDALEEGVFPIFAGGDHSLSLGTMAGASRYAALKGQPFFLLWLDAHPDFHRLNTTDSGNLHGTPVAYVTGQESFEGFFPPPANPVQLENICMMGIRSVDGAEHRSLIDQGVEVNDMRRLDEVGVVQPLQQFLKRVADENGFLHISLDVDFLEPSIAPAVGTTVPGGATFREAHLILEIVHESGLARSLDIVELNPFLDHGGMTATLMVDLCASLMGKTVMDRPTRSF